jgi:hypothetical protein
MNVPAKPSVRIHFYAKPGMVDGSKHCTVELSWVNRQDNVQVRNVAVTTNTDLTLHFGLSPNQYHWSFACEVGDVISVEVIDSNREGDSEPGQAVETCPERTSNE